MRYLNPKNWEQNRQSYLKDTAQIVIEGLADSVAVGYVKPYGNRASYLVFYGKQSRPKVHYSAQSLEAATKEVTRLLTEAKRRADRAATEQAEKKAHPEQPYTTREVRGITVREYDTAGTAQLIREALKKEFPTTKFSVRSSIFAGGSSVHITYTDGPAWKAVDAVCDEFQYGDFNGMDDSYNYRDKPMLVDENGPCFISYGAKYVSVSREFSAAYGGYCYDMDLRTRPSLGEQVEAYCQRTRAQYSYGEVSLTQHTATGNYLVSQTHNPDQLERFATSLRTQGVTLETEYENGQLFLAIYQTTSQTCSTGGA